MASPTSKPKKKSFYDQFFSELGETKEEKTNKQENNTKNKKKPIYNTKNTIKRTKKGIEEPVKNAGAISRAQQHYIQTQLEIQEREKQKREKFKEKRQYQRKRKSKSKAHMKRTKKGQPVLHLQINQLISKIEQNKS